MVSVEVARAQPAKRRFKSVASEACAVGFRLPYQADDDINFGIQELFEPDELHELSALQQAHSDTHATDPAREREWLYWEKRFATNFSIS